MTIFDKLIVLIVLNTLSVYANDVIKIRSGAARTLLCGPSSMPGTYQWKMNNAVITTTFDDIDDSSINTDSLRITRMTQQLVGVYECLLNDETQSTFDVKIVGLARFSMCQNEPENCSENHTYDSTLNREFTLNATIVFVNSGTDGCTENLSDPEWEVIVPPGNSDGGHIVRSNGTVNPPGIGITITTANGFRSNIATVIIQSANKSFQIVHLLHTDIDDGDSGQISVTFNFNYTESIPTTTTTSSTNPPTTSVMPTMTSMTPNMIPPSTSQISSTTKSIPGNSPTTTSLSTSSEVSVTPTNTNEDISGMGDSDDDGNSGVIIGVVVSLVVIIFIVVAAVIIATVIWRRHTRQRKYPPTTAGPSETTQSNGANGLASRPTTIQLSSQTPLLNLTGPNAYTDTATLPQPIDGAPMPYGNASDGINNNDDDVSDCDLDENTNDSSAVDI